MNAKAKRPVFDSNLKPKFDSLCKRFLEDVIEYAPETLTLKHAKEMAEDMTYMVMHGLNHNGMVERFKP